MPISITPSTPLQEVRLNIGDDDGSLIEDSLISYILSTNSNNVSITTLKCLDYIIANTARLADETTDEVSVKYSQTHRQLKQLREDLKQRFVGENDGNLFFVGGTLKSETDSYRNNSDAVQSPVKSGDALQDSSTPVVSLYDRFSFT